MSEKQAPAEVYATNISRYTTEITVLKGKRSVIGWLRLAIVIAAIIIIKLTWQQPIWLIFGETVLFIAMFLYALSVDTDVKQKLLNAERLEKINRDEVAVLNGDFHTREDGQQFNTPGHAYANDLDIFGPSSLYQYINRCTGEQGKQMLATALLSPLDKQAILLKQQAVKELSNKTAWRQQMQAFGMASPLTNDTEKKIQKWFKQPGDLTAGYWRWLAVAFPIISITTLLLYLFDVITSPVFYGLVFCFVITAFSLSKRIHTTWVLLSKIVAEADTIYRQLAFIEEERFEAAFINNIKKNLANKQGQKASAEIKQLKSILNRFDVRLNTFAFIILNTFLLWDLWQLISLNTWKRKNENAISGWFTAVAEMETLSSLGTLAFNQPAWCYPVINDEYFTLSAIELGHPLIMEPKRVNNNFTTKGIGKVSVITGSNMAGKSTFLRSIGVNVVLAMMGAPVAATSFSVSVVSLISSMRIADNLAESTSTFYAELKKLKSIIDAVNSRERIFILLDEILRGTNSLDRHTGSAALIKQFILHDAVAVIATHDVDLAKLENSYPLAIENFHFDVQVANNNELYFDYKLKPGVCTSLNASILMRKIGIELE
ncbi:MAG TPA: hypothetical protein VG738_19745 [Chitinophagaceae bacterium]|nr:hypothetical protein [Chitinophagaceae bacterium]